MAWQFWIDRGGTFTDVVAHGPGGVEIVKKLLSEDPERYEDAALEAIGQILKERGASFADVTDIKLGTTVATNALLERKGAKVVLVVTAGFGDALEIGVQARPDIFALHILKPELLHSRVIEVRERVSADGDALMALDEAHAEANLKAAYSEGFDAVAIACLHGWAYPRHEEKLAAIARAIGFGQISISSEISGLIKFVPRADTSVADAYVSPILRSYVDRFVQTLSTLGGAARVTFMQSNGGLAPAHAIRGRDAVLSGPAGGVAGMARAGERAGLTKVLGFDMGGTSTDVAHFAGVFERTHESVVAGVRLSAPMLAVHTVAAGGGSICFFDGARLRVGPQSAGAKPGPACYRRGGPLTITDCNLLLGRIRPEFFPALFGPNADERIDRSIVEEKFAALCADISRASGTRLTAIEAAEGFLRIANLNMAEAIKKISLQRGYDPADYVLAAFGGAGGQHACAVAEAVGVNTVLLHPLAGVLSAWGIGQTDECAIAEETVEQKLADIHDIGARIARLKTTAARSIGAATSFRLTANVKYEGGDFALPIPLFPLENLKHAFEAEHAKRFGFTDSARAIVLGSITVEAVREATQANLAPPGLNAIGVEIDAIAHVDIVENGQVLKAPVFQRSNLDARFSAPGPAIIVENGSTTFVATDWHASMNAHGDILLKRVGQAERSAIARHADPILLEVFHNRFMSIAEEMGLALQTTASSVNIKERLDFSCAIFDETGGLVANAPHIPVHLGSMSDSVRATMRQRGSQFQRGDVFMLNAPHFGGTHLPDITVIAPVIFDGEQSPAYFVAARGHHADIGGLTPGSMPPNSRHIDDEGVLIEPFLLIDQGRLRETEARALFASAPFPARDIDRNIADLKAQIAACVRGVNELERLTAHYGRAGVRAYMAHVQDNAEEQIRRVIDRLSSGAFSVVMDNGAEVKVAIIPDHGSRSLRVDFSGTSRQLPNNFNAPLAITRAAVLYVFRTLIDDNIPLNEGCLRPIEIIVPEGSFLNPLPGAAVVAGNVETSQIVVDALYGALGVLAASQGTMNNFTFGDASRQYYETVCGGAGAGPGFDGASAVQTHMTNSRLTDPEVLELRFPVLVESFSVRRGSGGGGAHKGGDGAVRRIRFRAAMKASILSNRRSRRPFGLAGGKDGKSGANWIERQNGARLDLGANGEADMCPGDVFVIETPGGGGYGKE